MNDEMLTPTLTCEELQEIILQHWGLASTLARKYKNMPGMDFDDVLQQARISLTKAAKSYDPDKGFAFSTYAWRVIQNDLNTLYTRQARRASVEVNPNDLPDNQLESWENNTPDPMPSIHDQIHSSESKQALHQAISKLPPRMQAVVSGILEGNDYHQIGRKLGFTKASSKTLVSRAYRNSLKLLRKELSGKSYLR